MRYCNSLLLLRLVTILLALLLAKDSVLVIRRSILKWAKTFGFGVAVNEKEKPALAWKKVDIFEPPPLNDTVAESLRLNELLARIQLNCKNEEKIGTDAAFVLCNETQYMKDGILGEALIISGSLFSEGSFIKALYPSRFTMFVPQGFAPLEELGNVDVELHYLMDLKDDGDWGIESMTTKLTNRKFASAFVNFYSPFIKMSQKSTKQDAPELLLHIMKTLRAKQLQLVVHIDAASAKDDLLHWYRAMYKLFFDFHYALIAAETTGFCGREIDRCKYRLSFVHYGNQFPELPVFGLGSPLEEKKRLLNYMFRDVKENTTCGKVMDKDVEVFCTIPFEAAEECVVVYIRYRKLDSTTVFDSFKPCKVVFISPLQEDWSQYVYHFRQIGLSLEAGKTIDVPGSEKNETWHLVPVSELLKDISADKIDCLMIDLNGGEWDAFEILLSAVELQKVQHFGLRMRLWVGEENENFRRFLSYFLRLDAIGFRKIAAKRQDRTTYQMMFERR